MVVLLLRYSLIPMQLILHTFQLLNVAYYFKHCYIQGTVAVVANSEAKPDRGLYKPDRTRPCTDECKHEREVKQVMLELEKLREKIARLECGISKGEMLYFEVIILQHDSIVAGCIYRHKHNWQCAEELYASIMLSVHA